MTPTFEQGYQLVTYNQNRERLLSRWAAVEEGVKNVSSGQIRELLRLALTGVSDTAKRELYEHAQRRDPNGCGDVGLAELRLLAQSALGLVLAKSTKGATLAALSVLSASGLDHHSNWRSLALKRYAANVRSIRGEGTAALEHLRELPSLIDNVRDGSRKEDRDRSASRAKRAVATAITALRAEDEERRLRCLADAHQLKPELDAVVSLVNELVALLDVEPVNIALLSDVLQSALGVHAQVSVSLLETVPRAETNASQIGVEWMLPLHRALEGSAFLEKDLPLHKIALQLVTERLCLKAWERALHE